MSYHHWITPLYAGLLGIILLWLSYQVSRYRLAYQITLGDGGQPALHRAIRAQANFTEYTPLALILLAGIELQGFHSLVINVLGSMLVVARLLHGIGLNRNAGASAPRALGAALTWLMILLTSFVGIFGVLSPARF